MGKRVMFLCVCVGALLTGSCTYYTEAKQARAEAEAARAEAEAARARAEEAAARAHAEQAALQTELARMKAAAKKEQPSKPKEKGLPPYPTETEARADLQALLARAGVAADVVKLQRTDWSFLPDQKYYGVAYEAELAFRADCQIKESMALMWSDANTATGSGGLMSVRDVARFKNGDKKKLRGHIGYLLRDGKWKLQDDSDIDAGK